MGVREILGRVRWGVVWGGVCLVGLLVTLLYGFALGLVVGSDVWGGLCQ